MSKKGKIAAVDLFCGVGGLTHGLEKSGISVRLGVDIDPSCQYPFEKNNQGRFLAADVTTLSADTIKQTLEGAEIKLLAGCAPCQPFSTYARSAKRSAASGDTTTSGSQRRGRGKQEDWTLVRRFGELINAVKPDLVTMENVPPLAAEPVFAELLECLSGYFCDFRPIECSRIGLPQSRQRLVLVASRLGAISIPEFDLPRRTVRQTIGNLKEIAAGTRDPEDPMHCSSRLSELNMKRIRASNPGGTWRDWPEELRARCHTKRTGATYPSVYGRMQWDAPAPTITTQCFGYGNGRFGHPEQHRAISLREAAMLQGFPSDYAFVPEGGDISFATLGRMIGNAVPVTLGEVIGRILVEHVELNSGKELRKTA